MSEQDLLKDLLRELGATEASETKDAFAQESADLSNFEKEDPEVIRRIGFDVAIYLGSCHRWAKSLQVVEALLKLERAINLPLKLWHLRCLVELGRFAEAVVLVDSTPWEKSHMIHVNYFAGLSFEGLKLKAQAKQRFLAVQEADTSYKNIAQLLRDL